jgi:uncharacterized protein DUF3135
MTGISTEFNFDEWAKLAKENPDAYEDMRQKMIQEVIDSTSPEVKRRMEGLQWKIDQIRSTSTNPMASCLKISQMMWDNVLGEDGLLENMRQLSEPTEIAKLNKPKESATIISINNNNTDLEKS